MHNVSRETLDSESSNRRLNYNLKALLVRFSFCIEDKIILRKYFYCRKFQIKIYIVFVVNKYFFLKR